MPHPKFIARLQAIEALSEDERRQIAALPSTLRQVADGEIVHVNRTIQELRHRGLIAWEGSEIGLLQPDELRKLADFAPDYLS
ncbi:winged helix-turn-helix domain-containing protein [Bradyrhizobium sp. UNPA324]|uniref:winged helix-turn-helix domain-containing protein n=1 Tax=Bradyrhizobium sp. UNPA324 TaxID=1141174 RepID=UPI001153474C|nr:winged helix-turn-helix domain-containing protein [Bradyrhizobium sp. UNPA324]TQF31853.1 hypothetical protein UNPA324_21185 [Bradyrhizobium sp. UNPA324]